MTAMFLRSITTGAVLAALAASPAAAAPIIDPLKPCYVVAQGSEREPIDVAARGFTPLTVVNILIDGLLQDQPKTEFDGSLVGTVKAPGQESGQREFTLVLAEHGNPVNTATTTAKVTRLSVTQSPSQASTRDRVRFRGSGFTDFDRPVYAHNVFAGRSYKSVRIGMPKGPCGTFSVKRFQFPFKRRPRLGNWTIYFDQLPHYSPTEAAVRVSMMVKVRKTAAKPRRAPAR